jgi:hypothetical protein
MSNLQIKYFNFIYNTLLAHASAPFLPTAKSALLRALPKDALKAAITVVSNAAGGKLPV